MRRTGTIGILSIILDGNGKHLADEVLAEIAIGAPQLEQIDSGAHLGYPVVCGNQIARTEVWTGSVVEIDPDKNMLDAIPLNEAGVHVRTATAYSVAAETGSIIAYGTIGIFDVVAGDVGPALTYADTEVRNVSANGVVRDQSMSVKACRLEDCGANCDTSLQS